MKRPFLRCRLAPLWAALFLTITLLAASVHAEDPADPLQAGRDLMHARKFTEAAAQFDRAVAADPQSAVALFERGNARAELGNTQQPLEDFTAAIRLQPRYFEAWYMRGHIHARRNDHDAAIEDFTEAIRLRPDSALAYHYRGLSHSELWQQFQKLDRDDEADAQKDLAAPDFAHAIALDPKLAEAHYLHARTAGWWLDNTAEFDTAIKLDPHHAQWYYWRGNVHLFRDENSAAVDDFTAAIRLDSEDQHFYNDRAVAYANLDQHDLAIADMTQAIRVRPDLPFFRHNRGHYYLHQKKWDLARKDFTDAIELKPDYWSCYLLRAKAESHLDAKTEARADLQQVVDHADKDSEDFKDAKRELESSPPLTTK